MKQSPPDKPSYPIEAEVWAIAKLPGLSSTYARKLAQAGVNTTADLVALQKNETARKKAAAQLKVRLPLLQRWIVMAELSQLPGVGVQYCGLLVHAGIVSLKQLSETSGHTLHRQVTRLQVATLRNARSCLTPAEVDGWVHRARLYCAQNSVQNS